MNKIKEMFNTKPVSSLWPVVAPWGGDGSPSLRGFELKTLD